MHCLETGIVVGVDYIFSTKFMFLQTRSDLNAAVDQTSAQSYTGSLRVSLSAINISRMGQDEVSNQ